MAFETEGRDFSKMRGFKDWYNGSKFSKEFKGPVMLVKFSKFKAMETLSEMIPGEEYDITVSGELKDEKLGDLRDVRDVVD